GGATSRADGALSLWDVSEGARRRVLDDPSGRRLSVDLWRRASSFLRVLARKAPLVLRPLRLAAGKHAGSDRRGAPPGRLHRSRLRREAGRARVGRVQGNVARHHRRASAVPPRVPAVSLTTTSTRSFDARPGHGSASSVNV